MIRSHIGLLVCLTLLLGTTLGALSAEPYIAIPWSQDGLRADLNLNLQQLPNGQLLLSWTPYPDVDQYVIYSSNQPLPFSDPGWTLIGESSGNNYLVTASNPRRFWYVRPKVVAPPEFFPPSGFYPAGTQLTLSSFPTEAWIMYKLEYQDSTATSYEYYFTPLPPVGEPRTIRAWAVKNDWQNSDEVFGVFSTPPQIAQAAPLPNTLQTVIDDMILPGQGFPHGVNPYWDWYDEAVVDQVTPLPQHHAFTSWGVLYEETRGNPATNTRVLIRNMRASYFSNADHAWHPLQNDDSGIYGKWYREDMYADSSFVSDAVFLPDGSVSARPGNGRCFHFWPQDRASIDGLPIDGIFVTCEAKLILDQPTPDDRLNSRYIISLGADYWTGVTGGNNSGGVVGCGRFKYVTTDWQNFNFCTLSQAEMEAYPPPF